MKALLNGNIVWFSKNNVEGIHVVILKSKCKTLLDHLSSRDDLVND